MVDQVKENYVKDIENKDNLEDVNGINLDDFDFKDFDEKVETSFQKFCESVKGRVNENTTPDDLESWFNGWLDSQNTILDSLKFNETQKKVIKPTQFDLQNIETVTKLSVFQQELNERKAETKETEMITIDGNAINIALYNGIDKSKILDIFNKKNFEGRDHLIDLLKTNNKDNVKKFQRIIVGINENENTQDQTDAKSKGLTTYGVDGLFGKETLQMFEKYVDNQTAINSTKQVSTPVGAVDSSDSTVSGITSGNEVSTTNGNGVGEGDDDIVIDGGTSTQNTNSTNVDGTTVEKSVESETLTPVDDEVEIGGNDEDDEIFVDEDDMPVDDEVEVDPEDDNALPSMGTEEILYEGIAYNVDASNMKEIDSDNKAIRVLTMGKNKLLKKQLSIADINYKPKGDELRDLTRLKKCLLSIDNPDTVFKNMHDSYLEGVSKLEKDKKNGKLRKLYKLYKEYRDDTDSNKKGPYFKKVMGLLENYFVRGINGKTDWSFKDLYNNEILGINSKVIVKRKNGSQERKANRNMDESDKKFFDEWSGMGGSAIEAQNTNEIMKLDATTLNGKLEQYGFDNVYELQFALSLSDMNADGRVDSQDFNAKTGQEIWAIYKDAKVDQKYGIIEKGPMQNMVAYATSYAERMGHTNTAEFLKGINVDDTPENIMKKLKERPITMQYMRLLLANSPKDGVNTILKYGSTEVQLSNEQKMLSELLVSPEYNALFEEKWKELVAQGISDDNKVKESWRFIIGAALLEEYGTGGGGATVGIAKHLGKAGDLAITVGVVHIGGEKALGASMSYGKTFTFGKNKGTRVSAGLSGGVGVGKNSRFLAAMGEAGIDQMLNGKQLKRTLDVRGKHFIGISGNISAGLKQGILSYGGALAYSQDKMGGLEQTYENIKSTIGDVLKDAIDRDIVSDKEKCMQKIKDSLKTTYKNTKDKTLNDAAERIYAGLAFYTMNADSKDFNDVEKKVIIDSMAENYALQWRNNAIKDLENDVYVSRVAVGVQILAGYRPIPTLSMSFEWYNNLYAHETGESMQNYYQQLASGAHMAEVNQTNKYTLYKEKTQESKGGITQEGVNYLNEKLAVIQSRMARPGMDLKIEGVNLSEGYYQSLKIPRELTKYVNINITKELKDQNCIETDGDAILVPGNTPISLLTYERTNTGKFNLIIGDTKASKDDIFVGPDTTFSGNISNYEGLKGDITVVDVNKKLGTLIGKYEDFPILSCDAIDGDEIVMKLKDGLLFSKSAKNRDGFRLDSDNNIYLKKGKVLKVERLNGNMFDFSTADGESDALTINYYPEGEYRLESVSSTATVSIETMSNNPEIDAMFVGIEKELSLMDNRAGVGAYATFMNAAAEAGIDAVLDESDYASAYSALRALLNGRLSDPKFATLTNYMDGNLSVNEKSLIVDKFKALFSYNDKLVNKGNLYCQLKDRKDQYKKLKGYDKTAEFPLTSNKDYRKTVWDALNEKNTFQREQNPNLIGMTAFYRLGNNNAGRSYAMTEIGGTNVLGGVTEKIEGGDLVSTKEWFWKNLDKSAVHKSAIKKGLLDRINNALPEGKKIAEKDFSDDQLKKVLEGGNNIDIGGENNKISVSLNTEYVFYLLGECANESIGVQMPGSIAISYETQNISGNENYDSVMVDGTREGLYTDSVESQSMYDLNHKGSFSVGLAFGKKKPGIITTPEDGSVTTQPDDGGNGQNNNQNDYGL